MASTSWPRVAALWGAIIGTALALAAGCPRKAPMEKFHVHHRADPSRYVDVDAVVLLDRKTLTYSFSVEQWRPYAELVHHHRVHILKPEALHHRKIFIPFDATCGILDVTARVTRSDGTTRDLRAVRTIDYNRFSPHHPAAVLYNEPAARVFAVPELQVGDVLEYQYRRVIKDASWVEPLRVGGAYPVERGEIAVVYPDGFDVDFRVLSAGEVVDAKPQRLPDRVRADPGDKRSDGVPGTKLLWVFEQVPALYPEPLRPADEALARQVQVQFKAFHYQGRAFSGFQGWSDVGRWYGRLIGDADVPDSDAKRIVKKIGAQRAAGKLDRVRRINRYLADEMVPIPFAGSLASLRVHGSASVLAAHTGDAKDLSNLALALLRAAGVEGFPVLCSRRGSRAIAPGLPTPEAFNSVIVAVARGGRYAFFAPDGFGLPAGRLPWDVQGTRGLLVRRSGSELVELPEDRAEDNLRQVEIRLALELDGVADGTAVLTLTGQDAHRARLLRRRAGDDGLVKWVQALLFGEGSTVEVTGVQPPKTDDSERPLKLLATLRATALATTNQQARLVTSSAVLGKPLDFLWREGRRTMVDFGYRLTEHTAVTVSLPDGWGIWELPPDFERDGPLVSVADRYSVADGEVRLVRERVQKVAQVEPADYGQLRAFYEELWRHQDLPIQIVRGGKRGHDYGEDPF